MPQTPLVQVQDVVKKFSVNGNEFLALNQVSLEINEGETLGIVGESGCGKSTLGKCLLKFLNPDSGVIFYEGKQIENTLPFRREIQMVFQDPYASLNPRFTVEKIIGEGIEIHYPDIGIKDRQNKIGQLLVEVGLDHSFLKRYPREMSGGQRQRIGIARALAVQPRLLVCDEPTSALDACTQMQILELLKKLKIEKRLTCLFISHNLSVIESVADRVAVMYRGKVVEFGLVQDIMRNPLHPYTQALISALPIPDPLLERSRKRLILNPDVPKLVQKIEGCSFHPRCPHSNLICQHASPSMREIGHGRLVACHLPVEKL